MDVVSLCYYTSYPRSAWGGSWRDRKGSGVAMAGPPMWHRWLDGFLLCVCLIHFEAFAGLGVMRAEVHPAVSLGWVYFLLFWVPITRFASQRSTPAPPGPGGSTDPLDLLPTCLVPLGIMESQEGLG